MKRRASLAVALLVVGPGCCTTLLTEELEDVRPPPRTVGAVEVRAALAGSLWYVEDGVAGRRRLRAWDGEAWRAASTFPAWARPASVEVTEHAGDGAATTVVLREGDASEEVHVGGTAPAAPGAAVVGLALVIPLALAVDVATAPLQLLGYLGAYLIFAIRGPR